MLESGGCMRGEDRGERRGEERRGEERRGEERRGEERRGGQARRRTGTHSDRRTHTYESIVVPVAHSLPFGRIAVPLSFPSVPDATGRPVQRRAGQTAQGTHSARHTARTNTGCTALRPSLLCACVCGVAPSALLLLQLRLVAWLCLAGRLGGFSPAGPGRFEGGDDDADTSARTERRTPTHGKAQGQAIWRVGMRSTLNLASRDARKVRSEQEGDGVCGTIASSIKRTRREAGRECTGRTLRVPVPALGHAGGSFAAGRAVSLLVFVLLLLAVLVVLVDSRRGGVAERM
jgi:hypothetical protein